MKSTSETALLSEITQSPWAFEFYQLVRILERERLRSNHSLDEAEQERETGSTKKESHLFFPVGESISPNQEPVRFKVHPAMVFEPAAVKHVKKKTEEELSALPREEGGSGEQWEVAVNIMGLIGASGVLPFRYSELIVQRLRAKDPAMKAFLDVFNHRTLSLLYRAWKKYRPAYSFESDALIEGQAHHRVRQRNAYQQMIAGLCGLSQQKSAFNKADGAWLNYAGVAAHRSCNEYTLKNVIYHHFGIKVKIHQFKGRWQRLDGDVVTRLAGGMKLGMNNQLGQNALLGERCWVAQNLFEIEVIDLDETQFASLSPGSQKLKALYEFVKQRAGIEMDFDLSLNVKEAALPVATLSTKASRGSSGQEVPKKSLLGWNTRLHRRIPSDRKIRISISKHGMQYPH